MRAFEARKKEKLPPGITNADRKRVNRAVPSDWTFRASNNLRLMRVGSRFYDIKHKGEGFVA